jgi:S1-C subfamily serine protease
MSQNIKGACVFCGGHIAYDQSNVGRTIQCPHCSEAIKLGGDCPSTVSAAPPPAAQPTDRQWLRVCALVACIVVALGAGIFVQSGTKRKAEAARKAAEDDSRRKLEQERLVAEAAKARAEADLAKVRLQHEEAAKVATKTAADAATAAALEIEKKTADEKRRVELLAREKARQNAFAWQLWEEQDHSAISIIATRTGDASVSYKGATGVLKYDELPEWLRTAAQAKHRQDGEAKGLIREINGKVFDLRASPGGWIALPAAEVIQIVDDGYLLIDVASLKQPYAQSKVFKLKHNGMSRILNTGDRIQVTAMTIGTYTYQNKKFEIKTVPAYDPGMPIGPLREKVVAMRAAPGGIIPRDKGNATEASKSGSGFFISDDGLFISNAHVVEDAIRVEVKTSAGKKRATVLRVDKTKDLALLRVSLSSGTVPGLVVSTNTLALGAQVFTIGYPLVDLQGSQPKFTDGKVSSMAGFKDDPDEIQISVAVQPGNSGGPLADLNGDIVGVVVARLDDLRVIELAGSIPQKCELRGERFNTGEIPS